MTRGGARNDPLEAHMPKLLSVNVSVPKDVQYRGGTIRTGIFKEPVQGRVSVRKLNLEGDGQADLTVHGGTTKAVYAYPVEHYGYWEEQLSRELPWGMFGENLTTEGILEDSTNIGDRFRIGTTEQVVTQPRMPCFKLGIRFERSDMVKRFLVSRRSGWYLSVVREGAVAAGDTIERISRDDRELSVADVVQLYVGEGNAETLRRAIDHPILPDDWKEHFRGRSG